MGLRYPSESCRLSGPRSHRVLRCPPRSVDVSVRRSGSSPSAVPCRLSIDRLILSWACAPLQSTAELRVRLSPAGWEKRLPWGFLPSWRHQPSAACTGIPTPTLPSSAFLAPSTASAPNSLAGLFHPAATSRVPLSREFPLGQVGLASSTCPALVPLPPRNCPTVARKAPLLVNSTSGPAPARGTLPLRRRLIPAATRVPPELSLLQVLAPTVVGPPSRSLRPAFSEARVAVAHPRGVWRVTNGRPGWLSPESYRPARGSWPAGSTD
jgi:hypothetical protein